MPLLKPLPTRALPRPRALRQIALGLLCAGAAHADPGYYVVTPYDNDGLRVVDFRYWTFQQHGRTQVVWPEVGFGYGVNSRWTTELFVSWEGSQTSAVRESTLNWQNDVLLTQGELPVDIAIHAQWIREADPPHQRTLEWGPVLQTDVGRTQLNLNFIFARDLGGPSDNPTRLKLQWQVRHRTWPGFHLGLQGFSELGTWNDTLPAERQSHRAGPAAFWTWRLQDRQAIKLQAAWLVGKTYGRNGDMATLRSTFEF
jgi:hypothetical protein